jgi:DeoR/GlpR family transcriptional regulator of sugar metabolism
MQKYDTTSSKVTDLDKDFSVSKVEIQKDLQFLKERFNSYQR